MNEIETYIQQFPDHVQEILKTIRKLIKANAPDADEPIAYGMYSFRKAKKC